LDLIRTEQNFQLSGEVDDNLAISIGKFFGAQAIISGRISLLGDRYRMTFRGLDVQTAQVLGQYNRNIAAGKTINDLMRSGGSSVRVTQSNAGGTTGIGNTTVAVPDGTEALNVNNVATWNAAINRIRNGGNDQTYVINVKGTVSVPALPSNENLFGSVIGLTVIIQGGGALSPSASGSLLRIAAGQTVVARNVTLRGQVVIESGSAFRMEEGATVTGSSGSGVYVDGGSFTMTGGTISRNSGSLHGGGGVQMYGGIFTMSGGAISANTTGNNSGGGGVDMHGGTFNMSGGMISSNTTGNLYGGGGVRISGRGTFTMSGGTISANTTGEYGGGVQLESGTFTMRGGTISGNKARVGGGVFIVLDNTFTKTGGTISGSDSTQSPGNTASGRGHAVYWDYGRWRNATAGPDDSPDGYGFWLND